MYNKFNINHMYGEVRHQVEERITFLGNTINDIISIAPSRDTFNHTMRGRNNDIIFFDFNLNRRKNFIDELLMYNSTRPYRNIFVINSTGRIKKSHDNIEINQNWFSIRNSTYIYNNKKFTL